MGLFEIDRFNQPEEGGMGGVTVGDRKILLAKYSGRFYAIDARCPHMGGDLCQGTLEGKYVICPRHGHKINITNGKHSGSLHLPFVNRNDDRAESYKVVVDGLQVKVEL